ncbi:hypothetical protein [Citricoccus sp.]|uniref:hypothetical protein n=1 Tax=Citricoccus sp. TaxID=1978372 RepID=UPI0028BF218D|nr:hypothetical protein [Citricoccus sp.]
MSAADLEEFYVHQATVRTLQSGGAWGDTFAPDRAARCFIDETRTLVRDGTGAEVISETTLTTPPEYDGWFLPGSEVDLPKRTATVIKAGLANSGPLDLPDHLEVALT